MEDAFLFEMLESAVEQAVNHLSETGLFQPFALALTFENKVLKYSNAISDSLESYDTLWETLKSEASMKELKAVVLLQECVMPQSLAGQTKQSIRVHVESSENKAEKIGARFLYIPYKCYSEGERREIKLFNPKPIAFPHEIFKI